MFVSLFDWLLVSLFVFFLVWSDQQIINKRSSDKQKDLPPSPKITYRHLSVIPSFRPILTLFYHSDAVPSFYYYIIILMSFQWEKARAFQSLFIATSSWHDSSYVISSFQCHPIIFSSFWQHIVMQMYKLHVYESWACKWHWNDRMKMGWWDG